VFSVRLPYVFTEHMVCLVCSCYVHIYIHVHSLHVNFIEIVGKILDIVSIYSCCVYHFSDNLVSTYRHLCTSVSIPLISTMIYHSVMINIIFYLHPTEETILCKL